MQGTRKFSRIRNRPWRKIRSCIAPKFVDVAWSSAHCLVGTVTNSDTRWISLPMISEREKTEEKKTWNGKDREVRRDGPKVPPFRCVWSWLRRRSTWRSAQTNAEKERMPTSLLAFSSPVWHDERQSGSASPSLAALCPDPWNISAVQSRWPGRRRAFEGGHHMHACRSSTVKQKARRWLQLGMWLSNCVAKPDNSHPVHCKSGGSQRCAVAEWEFYY